MDEMTQSPSTHATLRRHRLRKVIAALCLGLLPTLAQAQGYYPRSVGSGESTTIEYGPGPHGNIVGGGRVVASSSGEESRIIHLDPRYGQRPRGGLVPFTVGSGESTMVVWVPVETRSPVRRRSVPAISTSQISQGTASSRLSSPQTATAVTADID